MNFVIKHLIYLVDINLWNILLYILHSISVDECCVLWAVNHSYLVDGCGRNINVQTSLAGPFPLVWTSPAVLAYVAAAGLTSPKL